MKPASDSVTGDWAYNYDVLNRLQSASASSGPYASHSGCWAYDAFGKRTAEEYQTSACPSPESRVPATASYNGVNRVAWTSVNSAANGYQPQSDYILGQGGEQVTEMAVDAIGTEVWQHTNVWADGQLIATYDTTGQHFYFNDALGTRRYQADTSGALEQTCQSLPFGDFLNCTGSNTAPTEHHFTAKERDAESGNDYFGARYYASNMGRFMSPDPIIMNSLRLINPQRWNKYSYVINNPLILTDPSGKDAIYVDFNKMASGYGHAGIISVHADGSATYSRYGPATPGHPVGAGEVQTDSSLPTVQFGANGLPTDASYAALISAVAGFETKIEGSPIDPSTVGLDYFKTTPAETAALDAYIKQQQDASNAGTAPTYCVVGSSCRDYALGGLVAGGVIDQWRSPYFSVVPNTLFMQLYQGGFTDDHKDPEAGTKKNTTTPCLKSRDTGGCV